jgi:hypothetical protein
MKDMFESSESFTAHATIAAGYYMMQEAQERLDKATAKMPLDRMIDAATGADKDRLDKHKQFLCVCLIDIIEAKKVIEDDYSKEEEFLSLLNESLKTK